MGKITIFETTVRGQKRIRLKFEERNPAGRVEHVKADFYLSDLHSGVKTPYGGIQGMQPLTGRGRTIIPVMSEVRGGVYEKEPVCCGIFEFKGSQLTPRDQLTQQAYVEGAYATAISYAKQIKADTRQRIEDLTGLGKKLEQTRAKIVA